MVLRLTNLVGFGAGGSPRFEYMGSSGATGPSTLYSFIGFDFGADTGDRSILVVVQATSGSASTIQMSATGNEVGDDTSPDVSRANFDGSDQSIVGFLAGNPSGATGTVKAAFTAAVPFCYVSVYRVRGLASLTPADTGGESNTDSSFTCDLDVTAKSVVLGGFSTRGVGTGAAWTGITERSTTTYAGSATVMSADYLTTAAETPRTVTATRSASGEGCAFTAAWTFS